MDFYFIAIIAFFATIAVCAALDMCPAGRKISDVIFCIFFFPFMFFLGIFQNLLKK